MVFSLKLVKRKLGSYINTHCTPITSKSVGLFWTSSGSFTCAWFWPCGPQKCLGCPKRFLDHTLRTTVLVIAFEKQKTIWNKSYCPLFAGYESDSIWVDDAWTLYSSSTGLHSSSTTHQLSNWNILCTLQYTTVAQMCKCGIFHCRRDHVKIKSPQFLFGKVLNCSWISS